MRWSGNIWRFLLFVLAGPFPSLSQSRQLIAAIGKADFSNWRGSTSTGKNGAVTLAENGISCQYPDRRMCYNGFRITEEGALMEAKYRTHYNNTLQVNAGKSFWFLYTPILYICY